jgi:hypothetical protein
MDSYGERSVVRFSSQDSSGKRREEFFVPFLTAVIVLALGWLMVTVTCRALPQQSTPNAPSAVTETR